MVAGACPCGSYWSTSLGVTLLNLLQQSKPSSLELQRSTRVGGGLGDHFGHYLPGFQDRTVDPYPEGQQQRNLQTKAAVASQCVGVQLALVGAVSP